MTTDDDNNDTKHVYDWWSRHPRGLDLLYDVAFLGRESAFRQQSIETLYLRPGECVFEVGCGSGNSFEAIRKAVGRDGIIVGLDASRGMVRSARARIRANGWQNIHVLRGDARRPPVNSGAFDAAYASMSLSAVPAPERAIKSTKSALRPGGRLVVLDAQPFQQWPWRLGNSLIIPLAEWATNWEPQVDLLAVLHREFERVDTVTYNAGSIFIACAHTSDT